MRTLRRLMLLAAALTLAGRCGADDAEAKEQTKARAAMDKAKITLVQAIDLAHKESPGGKPLEAELVVRDELPVFNVLLANERSFKELRIDAVAGTITTTRDIEAADEIKELADKRKASAAARITLVQAVETAMKAHAGTVARSAEFDVRNGKPRFEIGLLTSEKLVKIEIDAVTGKVVEPETKKTDAYSWSFDKDPAGAPPPGWLFKQTNAAAPPGAWTVQPDLAAPSKPNVLSLKTENKDQTFNLALADKTSLRDVDISVKVRADSGKQDQGGGLVWRCKDENNYYVCRLNPLELNYRLYKVVNGSRKQLASADARIDTGKWYALRAVMIGNRIECYLDGRRLLDAKDDNIKDAGMVGLWSKADASTSFDDLIAKSNNAKPDPKGTKPRKGR